MSTQPLDAAAEAKISGWLGQMSLEEKVGQMIQADIASIKPEDLRKYKLGSVLAGGNAAPNGNVRSSPKDWLELTDALFRASLAAPVKGHPAIPILFGIDAVHGNAKLIGATIFPQNVALGAMHDADLIRRIGAATAREVAAVGIDWTFAPTVAVARDVRWGRSYESYSEAPQLVAQYAPAMVQGLQGAAGTSEFMAPGHTLGSVKHFLGDGGTRNGRDQGETSLPEAELARVHAAGYGPAIEAGALIVMASYNSWNGSKMHGNRHLLTEVLKERMGFRGFVVGDWNAQEQIPGCTKWSCPAAYLAGIDMLMAPDSWKGLFENTLAQARAGTIPPARIDDAVRRILRVKLAAGLFSRAAPKDRPDAGDLSVLGSSEHRAQARSAVRESLVLLKNSKGVLPLKPHAHILVCGDLADDIGAQSGGWTIDWQGDHNTNADFPHATSIFAGIAAAARAASGSAVLSHDGQFKDRPDVAVVVFGERPYAEFQGDRENLEYGANDKRSVALLKQLRSAGVPTVSVFLSGRVLWTNPEMNASDAFIAAWLPGSEGEGVADLLFGSADGKPVDFKGRLAYAWPATAMPVRHAIGAQSGALYPLGFGLSYADHNAAAVLAEDPKIAPGFRNEPGSLLRDAHATAPWSAFVRDRQDQVHFSSAHDSSPHGTVHADLTAAGVRIGFGGSEQGMFVISGRAVDLSAGRSAFTALRIRYRLEQPPDAPVRLRMTCSEPLCGTPGGATLDLRAALRRAPLGQWHELSVPLACFKDARLDAVEEPFALAASGRLQLTLAEVRLEAPAEATACPAQ